MGATATMSQEAQTEEKKEETEECNAVRQPAIYVNHGGGPLPYLQYINNKYASSWILDSFHDVTKYINEYKPKAICIVSAHWESSIPTLIYQSSPPLYYDYYNFPSESYQIKYPA
eukprot:355718_1